METGRSVEIICKGDDNQSVWHVKKKVQNIILNTNQIFKSIEFNEVLIFDKY